MGSVIDCHTHLFPVSSPAAAEAWGLGRGENHWARVVARSPRQDWPTIRQTLERMDRDGVEKAVLLGWYWQNPDTCSEQNQFYRRCLQEAPDRFLACAAVCARAGSDPVSAVRQAVQDWGFIGVGEVLPEIQGFGIRDALWQEVLHWAEQWRIPVHFHVTEAAGHRYEGRVSTELMDLVETGERFPQLPMVLAHWGGGLPFYTLNPRVRKALQNAFFDSAASPLLYDPRVWETVLRLVGSHRVCFGTDYPLRLGRPPGQSAGFGFLLAELHQAVPDPEVRQRVLGGNFRALLGRRQVSP